MQNKTAQTFIIYAVLIAILAIAMVTISMYLRRSVQGKYRDSADVFGGEKQYEPGVTTITK